jgi:hypothetical protein
MLCMEGLLDLEIPMSPQARRFEICIHRTKL